MTAKDNDTSPPTTKAAPSVDATEKAAASKPKLTSKATPKKELPESLASTTVVATKSADASSPAQKKAPVKKTVSKDTLATAKSSSGSTRTKTIVAGTKPKAEQSLVKTDTADTEKLNKEKLDQEKAQTITTKVDIKKPPAKSINKANQETLNEAKPVGATTAATVAPVQTIPSLSNISAADINVVQATNVNTSEPPQPVQKATSKARHRNPKPALSLSEKIKKQIPLYARLMRLDKPIGILLLLWPTLWSLWLAAKGIPRWDLLIIFVLGVVVMRSAGCVINDFADRKIDGKVKRTQDRPLAAGMVSGHEAIILFVVLCVIAFALVLFTNLLTIQLSVGGLLLAASYPYMKRHTHLPQVVLGAAFAWGIPMAFTAQTGVLTKGMWLIYLAVVLWTVAYDTFYAMVDRDDDLKIGVKSTAILFGEQDRLITGALQAMTIYALVLVGQHFELGKIYYTSVVAAAALFSYQQVLIRYREREACFKAFLNNNWVGAVIFAGIAGDFALR